MTLTDLERLARAATPGSLGHARAMGADYAANGANMTNCHFSLFATPAHTKAWEQGRDAALAQLEALP